MVCSVNFITEWWAGVLWGVSWIDDVITTQRGLLDSKSAREAGTTNGELCIVCCKGPETFSVNNTALRSTERPTQSDNVYHKKC